MGILEKHMKKFRQYYNTRLISPIAYRKVRFDIPAVEIPDILSIIRTYLIS